MNAYSNLIEYLDQNGMNNAVDNIDEVIEMVLKVLSDQRPRPQRFAVLPAKAMIGNFKYEESAIVSQFPLPVDLDQLNGAIKMLCAGIPVQTPDRIILPYPSVTVTQNEFEQ